ncbi:MAG: helix-turn-helix domain-containing protein [SAR86 cluster bacterium]|nr:helix-turn-helix domain-containing protein [SAR86 cluster bacterium]
MEKVVKSGKVGAKFKEARFKLNLSLEDISKNILINIKYLEAIEKDDYSIFPARAFALAYYKKYSKFLEIKDIFPLQETESLVNDKKRSIKSSGMRLAEFEKLIRDNFFKIIVFLTSSLILLIILSLNLIDNKSHNLDQSKSGAKVTEILDMKEIDNVQESIAEPMPNNNNLILIFSGPCWVEIYTDNKKPLIYKLYNNNEVLEIEIKKSFTLIIGNIDNVNADYAGKNINLIDSANEQKVSITTFKNE